MARTKTTNRLTGAEMPPPNTCSAQARTPREREESPQSKQSPPPPPSSSTKTNKAKGKRPASEDVPSTPPSPSTRSKGKMTMNEEAPPPPISQYRGNGYRSLLQSIAEPDEAPLPLHKIVFDNFPEEQFSTNKFTMLRNFLFWKNVVVHRPLCGSFLADLNVLKEKGLDFTEMMNFQGWTPLFDLKDRVFPNLVKEFYANLNYHNGMVTSFVRRRNIYLDAERISEILGHEEGELIVYTSGKWDPALYHDALACICTRISLSDGVTPTHKSLGPVYAKLHRLITHIILPQNGSYQRVSFCDTLVLFALIMRVKISFAYLMMRHMHDCIKSDRNTALPYSIFLTKVFRTFHVDFENEPYEEKFSYLKGGGAVKKVTKRNPKVARKNVEEEVSCAPPKDMTPAKPQEPTTHDDSDFYEGLYMCLDFGFFTDFWGLLGPLLFWRTWRIAYVRFLNKVTDYIYVMVALKFGRWIPHL